MADLPSSERKAFYRASLFALRFVEAQRPTNRRFGADADARWKAFQGDLTTADRIDLLIRDANAEFPQAFGARTVFDFRSVAEDEAFGPAWEPLEPVDANEMWRAALAEKPPETLGDAFLAVARCWDVPLDPPEVGEVGAADRLLVVGPGAATSVATHFAATGSALDWTDQVECVATTPAHRHIAALAGAFLRVTKPARILSNESAADAVGAPRIGVESTDAADEDSAFAHNLPEVSWP